MRPHAVFVFLPVAQMEVLWNPHLVLNNQKSLESTFISGLHSGYYWSDCYLQIYGDCDRSALEEERTIVFQRELVIYQAQPAVPRLGKQ